MKMYVIYDKVKKESGNIQLYKNDKEALRATEYAYSQLEQNKNAIASPEDFKLMYIGEFNTESLDGQIVMPEIVLHTVDEMDENGILK